MNQMRKLDACQVEVKSSADDFFDAFNNKAYLMPKMTSLFSEVKLVEGTDWNVVRSVRIWYYIAPGGDNLTMVKEHRYVDEKNRTIVYTLEGGEIGNAYQIWRSILSITPKGEGSLVKWTMEYEKKNDGVPDPVKYCDFYNTWVKDVDAYLCNA